MTNKWIMIGGNMIVNMDQIDYISSKKVKETSDIRGNIISSYILEIYLTTGKVVPTSTSYSINEIESLIKSILSILNQREETPPKNIILEKSIEELRQMILHLPQVGSVYIDAKDEFETLEKIEPLRSEGRVGPRNGPTLKSNEPMPLPSTDKSG